MDVRADMSLFAGTLSDPLAYGLADVRFGSKADISLAAVNVRFVPIADMGTWPARVLQST